MAIYSCNISNVSRAKGSSACATLSYISAEKIRDERTGELYNYGREQRVIEVATMLPAGAPQEYEKAERLFNSIENFEKAENARTAKKIIVALPREFDLDMQSEGRIQICNNTACYCGSYNICSYIAASVDAAISFNRYPVIFKKAVILIIYNSQKYPFLQSIIYN